MASETTGRESDKFMLRLPDGMRDRIRVEAESNKRSMNAEIVSRLQESLDAPARQAAAMLKAQADALRSQHESMKRQAASVSETMEMITAQLARIEAKMAETGVMPKEKGR